MSAVILTEREAVELIEASSQRRIVRMVLGSNRLPDVPGNEWAHEFIAQRRFEAEVPLTAKYMVLQEAT